MKNQGRGAEIDHLGSFREAKWPGRGPDPSSSGPKEGNRPPSPQIQGILGVPRIYGLRGDGA
jgi:hypothetical protein